MDAVRQFAAPVAKRLTILPLFEEQVSTAARRSCHRHAGKGAAVGSQKAIEGFDAVIAARVPIAVDDDEASAPDADTWQRASMNSPPLANWPRLSGRFFLPAN